MGSMPFAMRELDSGALARRLAQKLGGEVLDLSAPAVADSPADAEVLRNQRDIRRALDLARNADVALLGVGNLNPAQSGFVKGGFLSAEELAIAGGRRGSRRHGWAYLYHRRLPLRQAV